jgi:hypothetical protein
MDIRTRNTNTDQNEEEDEEQEDLLTAFDRHLRTVNRLFDERRQKQQLQQEQTSAIAGVAAAASGGISTQLQQLQISGAPPPPQKQGMRSLLVKAVRQAQVNNVKHMLTDSSPETISAVWEKDEGGGDTLFDEMVKSTSEKHKEIMHLLKAYMAKYPQPQQSLSNPIIILEDE